MNEDELDLSPEELVIADGMAQAAARPRPQQFIAQPDGSPTPFEVGAFDGPSLALEPATPAPPMSQGLADFQSAVDDDLVAQMMEFGSSAGPVPLADLGFPDLTQRDMAEAVAAMRDKSSFWRELTRIDDGSGIGWSKKDIPHLGYAFMGHEYFAAKAAEAAVRAGSATREQQKTYFGLMLNQSRNKTTMAQVGEVTRSLVTSFGEFASGGAVSAPAGAAAKMSGRAAFRVLGKDALKKFYESRLVNATQSLAARMVLRAPRLSEVTARTVAKVGPTVATTTAMQEGIPRIAMNDQGEFELLGNASGAWTMAAVKRQFADWDMTDDEAMMLAGMMNEQIPAFFRSKSPLYKGFLETLTINAVEMAGVRPIAKLPPFSYHAAFQAALMRRIAGERGLRGLQEFMARAAKLGGRTGEAIARTLDDPTEQFLEEIIGNMSAEAVVGLASGDPATVRKVIEALPQELQEGAVLYLSSFVPAGTKTTVARVYGIARGKARAEMSTPIADPADIRLGETVMVERGPLMGLTGRVVEINRNEDPFGVPVRDYEQERPVAPLEGADGPVAMPSVMDQIRGEQVSPMDPDYESTATASIVLEIPSAREGGEAQRIRVDLEGSGFARPPQTVGGDPVSEGEAAAATAPAEPSVFPEDADEAALARTHTPETRAADVEGYRRSIGSHLEHQGTVRESSVQNPLTAGVSRAAARARMPVTFVESEDGTPLPAAGWVNPETGHLVVDVNGELGVGVGYHELVHVGRNVIGQEWVDGLYNDLLELDPEGLAEAGRAGAELRAKYELELTEAEAAEEAVADRVTMLGDYLAYLDSPAEARRIADRLAEQPGRLRRFTAWLRDMLSRLSLGLVSASERTRILRSVDELAGGDMTAPEMAARILEAFDEIRREMTRRPAAQEAPGSAAAAPVAQGRPAAGPISRTALERDMGALADPRAAAIIDPDGMGTAVLGPPRVGDRVEVMGRAGEVIDATGSGARTRLRVRFDGQDTGSASERRGARASREVVVDASQAQRIQSGTPEPGSAREKRRARAEREQAEGAAPRFALAPDWDSGRSKRALVTLDVARGAFNWLKTATEIKGFVEALKSNKGAVTLTEYTAKELGDPEKFRVFKLDSADLFYAAKKVDREDGTTGWDVVGVINNAGDDAKGLAVPGVMVHAIETLEGDFLTLDAFDVGGFLPDYYGSFGFEVTETLDFDASYWDPKKLEKAIAYWAESSRGAWTPEYDGAGALLNGPPVVMMALEVPHAERQGARDAYFGAGPLGSEGDLREASDLRAGLPEGDVEEAAGARGDRVREAGATAPEGADRAGRGRGLHLTLQETARRRPLDSLNALRFVRDGVARSNYTSIIEGAEAFEPERTKAGGKAKVSDMARAFEERALRLGYRVKDKANLTPEELERIAEGMYAEMSWALQRDDSGIGWYERKIIEAMGIVADIHPELAEPGDARTIFTIGLAITSNGANVYENFKNAETAYQGYKDTGSFPVDATFGGERVDGIQQGLVRANYWLKEWGPAKLRSFLVQEHFASDLKRQFQDDKSLPPDVRASISDIARARVPGSVIFGPKIGAFFGNLNGQFEFLTADVWFARTWNRHTGHPIVIDESSIEMSRDKFRATFATATPELRAVFRRAGVTMKDARRKGDTETVDALANAAERELAAVGFKYGKLEPSLKDFYTKANTLTKKLKGAPVGTPRSGSEREMMRQTIGRVQQLLKQRGHPHITAADIQAVLWYFEKNLFVRYGAANAVGKPADYADAARALRADVGVASSGGASAAARGMFALAPPTNSKAFRDWFGDSKVVDENGAPLVVYHGTSGQWYRRAEGRPSEVGDALFRLGLVRERERKLERAKRDADEDRIRTRQEALDEARARYGELPADARRMAETWDDGAEATFDTMRAGATDGGWFAKGAYFTPDPESASDYATGSGFTGRRVLPTYLSIQNPYINAPDGSPEEHRRLAEKAYGDAYSAGFGRSANDTGAEAAGARAKRAVLEELGYDGEFVPDGDGSFAEYVAFHPEQIKSATGNRGTFDGGDPDMRYALAPDPAAPGLSMPDGGTIRGPWDRLQRAVSDKFVSVANYVQWARNMGAAMSSDPESAIRRFYGKIADRGERIEETFIRPMNKLMASAGITIERFGEHARDRHIPEANEHFLRQYESLVQLKESRKKTKMLLRGMTAERKKRVAERAEAKRELSRMRADGGLGAGGMRVFENEVRKQEDRVARVEQDIADLESLLRETEREIRDLYHVDYRIPGGVTPREFFHEVRPLYGVKTSEAEARVRADRSGPQGEVYKELGQMLDALNRQTRDQMLEDGLLSPEQHAGWSDKFRHYVPMRRNDVEQNRFPGGRGFGVRGPETKRRRGSQQVDNPYGFSIMQAQKAIERGEKNQVGNAFYRFAQENGDLLGITMREVEADEMGGLPLTATEFHTKVNGRDMAINVADPDMADAIRGISRGPRLSDFGAFARNYLRVFHVWKQLVTSYSPEFIPTNFLRDVQTALGNAQSLAEQLDIKDLRKELVKRLKPAVRATWAWRRTGQVGTSKMDIHLDEYRRAGGRIGMFASENFDDLMTSLEKGYAREATPGVRGKAVRTLVAVGDFVQDANLAAETASRLALFSALRDKGVSVEDAAHAARQLTTDFNQTGEWGTFISAFYAFASASIGGSRRLVQELHRSGRSRQVAAGLVAYGVLSAFLNEALSPEDEDGTSIYSKIPEYEKTRNHILVMPNGVILKVPMPYGWSIFPAIGRLAAERVMGQKSSAKAAKHLFLEGLETFNPIGSSPSFLQFLSPTMLDPVVQVVENKNFAGAPIHPMENPYAPEVARFDRNMRNTSAMGTMIARGLNTLTGGDDVEPGAVNLAGSDIDHLFEFTIGQAGKFWSRVIRTGGMIGSGEYTAKDLEWSPLIRRFYGSRTEFTDSARFYEELDDLERLQIRMDRARSDDRELYSELRRRHGRLLPLARRGERLAKHITKLRDQAYAGGGAPDREKLDEINRLMQGWMRDYLAAGGSIAD